MIPYEGRGVDSGVLSRYHPVHWRDIMSDYYISALSRLKELLEQQDQIEREFQNLERQRQSLLNRTGNLIFYLREELSAVGDDDLKQQLERIILQQANKNRPLETNPTEIEKITQETSDGGTVNKTHVVLSILLKGTEGLTPSQIYEKVSARPASEQFPRQYVHNVLGKLKSRELVVKRKEAYSLTEKGVQFAKEAIGKQDAGSYKLPLL